MEDKNKTNITAVKYCPFCGSSIITARAVKVDGEDEPAAMIRCNSCLAGITAPNRNYDEAVALWNKRVNPLSSYDLWKLYGLLRRHLKENTKDLADKLDDRSVDCQELKDKHTTILNNLVDLMCKIKPLLSKEETSALVLPDETEK